MKYKTDVVIIGGGAAGMAAAYSATREGADVILLERDEDTGGVLNQCIHNGFGLHYFKKDLTGPEFKELAKERIKDLNILYGTYVLEVTKDKRIIFVDRRGIHEIETKALVMATGARERHFNSLPVPGKRITGVFTAGLAQRFINLENLKPGNKAVILGSGDIGLIMARRLTLEGIKVEAVLEIMPYPGGLERNIQQCLRDFNIPLYLSHTVTAIEGEKRLEKVIASQVDYKWNPIPGTEKVFDVDMLITSVGLIPSTKPVDFVDADPGFLVSNTNQTSEDWIFAAGNCTVIFDLVDFVAKEGEKAGKYAALYAQGKYEKKKLIKVRKGENIGIVHPVYIDPTEESTLYIRVSTVFEKASIKINPLGIEKVEEDARPPEMIVIKIRPFDGENIDEIEVTADELISKLG
ncbi:MULTISPECIES: NAD(P)/FAD-dependent oxidoreductase [unclassified Marinitoga]|uniref:NAD(P)/FAD-dependent oxidoreductase n=1 Tax=unclassified Marinitoga TaxID=2640159 RepID=UPI0009504E4F|nr:MULTISPECIES: FAD-dependent oxidoreductase [unclassified Marinitoga]APT76180.1 pyridine nucleotide-disulfide oxidoreductase [Marinitoga sp. 1137]NUU97846.1 pyridine nucleotide-disulfide oxidoreductase [Marinitoga sp. 1138]